MQEEKRGAGRPRNKQYYLFTCSVERVESGKIISTNVQFTSIEPKFPKYSEIKARALALMNISDSPNITVIITNVYQFVLEEDYLNFISE